MPDKSDTSFTHVAVRIMNLFTPTPPIVYEPYWPNGVRQMGGTMLGSIKKAWLDAHVWAVLFFFKCKTDVGWSDFILSAGLHSNLETVCLPANKCPVLSTAEASLWPLLVSLDIELRLWLYSFFYLSTFIQRFLRIAGLTYWTNTLVTDMY